MEKKEKRSGLSQGKRHHAKKEPSYLGDIMRIPKLMEKSDSLRTTAYSIVSSRKKGATPAELKFMEVAERKSLNLDFRYPIFVTTNGLTVKFHIVDFCDVKRKIVFEVGNVSLDSPRQKSLHKAKISDIKRAGYAIFRITDEDIMSGLTTSFLYKAYMSIGIDIITSPTSLEKKPLQKKSKLQ